MAICHRSHEPDHAVFYGSIATSVKRIMLEMKSNKGSGTFLKAVSMKPDALLAETKKLEGVYAKKLADLEELKKSVLRSAFAGKL